MHSKERCLWLLAHPRTSPLHKTDMHIYTFSFRHSCTYTVTYSHIHKGVHTLLPTPIGVCLRPQGIPTVLSTTIVLATRSQHAPHRPTHLTMLPPPLALVDQPPCPQLPVIACSMSLRLIQWPLLIWPSAQAAPISPGDYKREFIILARAPLMVEGYTEPSQCP